MSRQAGISKTERKMLDALEKMERFQAEHDELPSPAYIKLLEVAHKCQMAMLLKFPEDEVPASTEEMLMRLEELKQKLTKEMRAKRAFDA